MDVPERSLLSRFLVLLRQRRGYSAQYLAHRLNMPVVDYVLIEESPERMPMCELHRILTELGISSKEFMDFSVLSEYAQAGVKTSSVPNLAVKDILALFETNNSHISDV